VVKVKRPRSGPPHGGILDVNDLVGLVAPAPTFSIANARVHVTARLTARYREVLRTSHYRGRTPLHSARPGPRSRAWHPRLYWPGGRRLRPESMGHCRQLSTFTHLGSPHSRAQRAPPSFRTCITCSCSWDRHEKGNPHAVYSRGQGAAARADAPSPWRALPAQCAHDSARRGGWNNPRLVMTRLISVFRVPFE